MFRAPQWHGAVQTHFPPRPGKSPWHCDIMNVLWPHGLSTAHISFDTTNDPAHQRHAAFTPACFALPSGTAPRKHTSHQGRANPNGTATSRTYFGHTVRHTLEAKISHDTPHPAHQGHAAFTPACFALPSGTAPRKRTSHQGRASPHGTATSSTYFGHTVCPHTATFVLHASL